MTYSTSWHMNSQAATKHRKTKSHTKWVFWVSLNYGPPKPKQNHHFTNWSHMREGSLYCCHPTKIVGSPNRKLQSMNFCIIHLNFFEYQLDFHFSTPQNASSEFIERRPENETQGKCSRNAVNTGWTTQTTHKSPDIFSYFKPTL